MSPRLSSPNRSAMVSVLKDFAIAMFFLALPSGKRLAEVMLMESSL